MSLPGDVSVDAPPPENDPKALRNWWHGILRKYGHHACCAVFLAFSADTALSKYLDENAEELHLMSGEHCLVMTFSDIGFVDYQNDRNLWHVSLDDHINKGYSNKIAKIFKVRPSEFPCLLVFRDIRSPEKVKIDLRDLATERIVKSMRVIFTIIQEAATNKKDPLAALRRHKNHEALIYAGKSIVSGLGKIAEKSLGTAVEATLKTVAGT